MKSTVAQKALDTDKHLAALQTFITMRGEGAFAAMAREGKSLIFDLVALCRRMEIKPEGGFPRTLGWTKRGVLEDGERDAIMRHARFLMQRDYAMSGKLFDDAKAGALLAELFGFLEGAHYTVYADFFVAEDGEFKGAPGDGEWLFRCCLYIFGSKEYPEAGKVEFAIGLSGIGQD